MSSKEYISPLGFDQIKDISEVDYMDECIAIHTDIREVPFVNGSLRMDMVMIVGCAQGKMQGELNAVSYTIQQNELIVCLPNDVITGCMLSPDFSGMVLCLSQRGLLEQFPESELWNKVFRLSENHVVKASPESLQMLRHYGEALQAKLNGGKTPYYREIVVSLVKAALYELLGNVGEPAASPCSGRLVTQREVLFKRFVELISSIPVKPRSVTWYADRLCVTPKYLSTVCKQVSGKTALAWINEYMLADVRHWLKNSNKTIKEVADLLHFPNNSFFGKYCRTHFGMSPSEFRRKVRQQSDVSQEG